MPRVARAKSSSGYYHVMARGSGGQLLFECGEDYAVFLESLGSCADEHSVSLIAYCLMPNHVHLLVRDGDDELGEMMRSLLSGYAQSYNKRTGHVGHVFQQRFKSCPVESDEYLSSSSATYTRTRRRRGSARRKSTGGAAITSM